MEQEMELNISKPLVVLLVVIMVAGTLSMFAFSCLLADDEDPREESHSYYVYGTLDGEECTGTGTSEYARENTNYHNYNYVLELETASGESETVSFGMIFTSDDEPNYLYTYVGDAEYGGETVGVWYIEDMGVGYTFYVSEYCAVVYAEIESDGMSLVMELAGD